MDPTPEQIPPEVTEIHAEIAALREKVDRLMKDRIAPAVLAATDRALDIGECVEAEMAKLAERIKARPLCSIGIAAATGYILAAVKRR